MKVSKKNKKPVVSRPWEGEMGALPRKESDFQFPSSKKSRPYTTKEVRSSTNPKTKRQGQTAG